MTSRAHARSPARSPKQAEPVKAWHIFDGDPHESSLLVFADSRNRARHMAHENGTWDYEEYIYIRARRAAEYDGLFDKEIIVDTNDDLPAGTPPFYDDDYV